MPVQSSVRLGKLLRSREGISPDNFNFFGLAESVTAVLCLLVVVRIEIQVMQDHTVGCRQVDTETT